MKRDTDMLQSSEMKLGTKERILGRVVFSFKPGFGVYPIRQGERSTPDIGTLVYALTALETFRIM